jgi:hypothetical protein
MKTKTFAQHVAEFEIILKSTSTGLSPTERYIHCIKCLNELYKNSNVIEVDAYFEAIKLVMYLK